MRLLGIFLLALAGAVLLGQALSGTPGVIAIHLGDHLIRTSLGVGLVLALVLAALVFLLARLGWRLFTFRKRLRRWRQLRATRLGHSRLSDGVLALAAGEYARAERLLAPRDGPGLGVAHYLAAARAAHALEAGERRDEYLARAEALAPAHQGLPIALQQVEMQLAAGELAAAEGRLAELLRKHRAHPQVLSLQHRCLAARDRWEDLVTLLPRLKRANVYPVARLAEIEAECAARILSRPYANKQSLEEAWERLPRQVRSTPIVIAGRARVLLSLGAHAEAEAALRATLKSSWDPRLLALYGEIAPPAAHSALTQAEHWLRAHPDEPVLLLTLGRLCLTERLWGKAREYLETACRLAPSPGVHRLLADTLEQLGEHAAAAQERRLGLELMTPGTRPMLPAG